MCSVISIQHCCLLLRYQNDLNRKYNFENWSKMTNSAFCIFYSKIINKPKSSKFLFASLFYCAKNQLNLSESYFLLTILFITLLFKYLHFLRMCSIFVISAVTFWSPVSSVKHPSLKFSHKSLLNNQYHLREKSIAMFHLFTWSLSLLNALVWFFKEILN